MRAGSKVDGWNSKRAQQRAPRDLGVLLCSRASSVTLMCGNLCGASAAMTGKDAETVNGRVKGQGVTAPRKQPHRAAGSLNPIERAVGRTAGGSINSKRRSAVTDLGGRGGGRRKGKASQHGLPNRVAGVEQL